MSQIKLIIIALSLAALMLVLKTCGGSAKPKSVISQTQHDLLPENGITNTSTGIDQLSIVETDADSPQDSVRTLVAHVKKIMRNFNEIKNGQDKISTDHQSLTQTVKEVQEKNSQLTDTLGSIDKKLEVLHKNGIRKSDQEGRATELHTEQSGNLLSTTNNLGQASLEKPQYVVYQDLGAEQDSHDSAKIRNHDSTNNLSIDAMPKTVPINMNQKPTLFNDSNQLSGVQTTLNKNDQKLDPKLDPDAQSKPVSTSEARYTIPENTTLLNAVLYTGLLGRIPVQGVIDDPYPFTVLIAAENLAAMGFKIPAVRGMIMRGRAKGDLNLSCVSGDIVSATYIFEDGTIKTFHGDSSKPLAVIEDKQGLPCVPGKLITNAPKFLAIRALLGGLEGAATATAQTEATTTVSGNTGLVNSTITGDKNSYILNSMGAKAANETNQWWQERIKQSFDVIFVKPGERVSLLVMQEMQIDIDTSEGARKVRHKVSNTKAQYQQTGLD